jgi:undecaprenyl-diphosphatase
VDPGLLIKSLVMGVVEGLTEFLPISSTGHLILVGQLLRFNSEKGKVFEIVIQTGAMLAVLWEYRARFVQLLRGLVSSRFEQRFVVNLAIAFVPAAVLGAAFGSSIKTYLFKPVPVAAAFIAGGLIILWVERLPRHPTIQRIDEVTWPVALQIGLAQCAALIPGTSRAGATIIGGMLVGLSRRAATEFSFFLAVPTLVAAGAYDLLKERALLSTADVPWFAAGLITAFLCAFACIRWLLRYVSTHDFTAFAVYRIVFGGLVLVTGWLGLVDWVGE